MPTNLARQIEALEAAVQEEPSSCELRSELLMAYAQDPGLHGDPRRTVQILWHVRNQPRASITRSPFALVDPTLSPAGFSSVERAWASLHAQLPDDTDIARGFACFLAAGDPERALALLRHATTLDPADAGVWQDMGRISRVPADQLRYFLEARDRSSSPEAPLLEFIASSALRADEMGVAEAIGRELLERSELARARYGEMLDWREQGLAFWTRARAATESVTEAHALVAAQGNYADSKHMGHTALGVVALRRGDAAMALAHLRESAAVVGSPRLASYGPSLLLANELALAGCLDEVSSYLGRCQLFWDGPCLESWLEELAQGRVPAFSLE
jgi:tetratricopeptide (TPR) repeat protein